MRIIIPEKIHQKVMFWVNHAPFEVSGFGKVIWDDESQAFTVVDAILLKQEGGAAHTDIDPASLGKAMYELRDTPGDLNWWWHSHVQMPTFWSGTDTDTIKKIASQGYCVATVFNQKNSMKSAFGARYEGPFNFVETKVFDDIPTEIERPALDENLRVEWLAQFTEHITVKPAARCMDLGAYSSMGIKSGGKKKKKDKRKSEADLLGYENPYAYGLEDDDADGNVAFHSLAIEEAKLLGMHPREVMAIYERNDPEEIYAHEARVDRAYIELDSRKNPNAGILDMTDTRSERYK